MAWSKRKENYRCDQYWYRWLRNGTPRGLPCFARCKSLHQTSFLSAVDGILADRILGALDPETTLTVVSSKSFSTRETMLNAELVNEWYAKAGIVGKEKRAKHVFLVSAKENACELMDLPEENRFPIWPWVGGRFSVWGAIGLPLVIALGPEVFSTFLHGAYEMDRHMLSAEPEQNLPLTLALLSYWNSTELQMQSHCLLPYDERLRLVVAWLQQLEMEVWVKAKDRMVPLLLLVQVKPFGADSAMKPSTPFING